MTPLPDIAILAHFGIELIAPLGGRLNQHWLVERHHERLVLRRWAQPYDEIRYELRLLEQVAALGWPVAPALAEPFEWERQIWSIAPFLEGEPHPSKYAPDEQRRRGHILARFHADVVQLPIPDQRGSWRRCEEVLADQQLDHLLDQHAQHAAEESALLVQHLDEARRRIEGMQLHSRPAMIVHGDFTPWNLLFKDGQLSGILDFELAHRDHRVAEFCLAWRGKYDDVIHAYNEVSPLEPEEWALLTPLWWAFLIEQACQYIRQGIRDDGWVMKQLLRRSALTGA